MSAFQNDLVLERARRHRSRASQIGELKAAGLSTSQINDIIMSGGLTQPLRQDPIANPIDSPDAPYTPSWLVPVLSPERRMERFRDVAAFAPPEPGLIQGRAVQEEERRRRERILFEQARRTPVESFGGLTPDQFIATRRRAGETPEQFTKRVTDYASSQGLDRSSTFDILSGQGRSLPLRDREPSDAVSQRRLERGVRRLESASEQTRQAIVRRFGDSGPEYEAAVERANENIEARNARRLERGRLDLQPTIITDTARGNLVREARTESQLDAVSTILEPPQAETGFQYSPQAQRRLQTLSEAGRRLARTFMLDGQLDEDEWRILFEIRDEMKMIRPTSTTGISDIPQGTIGGAPAYIDPATGRIGFVPQKRAESQSVDPKIIQTMIEQGFSSEEIADHLSRMGGEGAQPTTPTSDTQTESAPAQKPASDGAASAPRTLTRRTDSLGEEFFQMWDPDPAMLVNYSMHYGNHRGPLPVVNNEIGRSALPPGTYYWNPVAQAVMLRK